MDKKLEKIEETIEKLRAEEKKRLEDRKIEEIRREKLIREKKIKQEKILRDEQEKREKIKIKRMLETRWEIANWVTSYLIQDGPKKN